MNQHQQVLDRHIQEFRRKYYLDKIVRGSLILLLLVSSILFIALLSEGLFGFSSGVRTGIVAILGISFMGVLAYMVAWPVFQLFQIARGIDEYRIADMVKQLFPDVNDKLLNFLQLRKEHSSQNALVQAAIDQKAAEISPVPLSSGINLNVNRRYAWYLLIPLFLYLITYFANPAFLGTSSHRLFNYQEDFLPPAPFALNLGELPDQLVAGDNFELNVQVSGNELPAELYVYMKSDAESQAQFIDYNLEKSSNTEFRYTFTDIKEGFSFYVGNPDVKSETHQIAVIKRPFIKSFRARINYPDYTGLPSELLEENVGDFKAIKGSYVSWELKPQGEVDQAYWVGNQAEPAPFKIGSEDGKYLVTRRLMLNTDYFISLVSPDQIENIDTVTYRATVVQDRFPSIYVFSPNNDFLVDLDPNMPLDLEVADDFGFSKMALFYRFVKSGGTSEVSAEYRQYSLSIDQAQVLQQLGYNIDLTSLGMSEGDELEYYLKVWDNDGVSGPKAASTAVFKAVYPTLAAKYEEVTAEQDEVKDELSELKKTSESLKDDYRKMQEKMLQQKQLSFDDKKEVQRMVDEHKKMLEQLQETQEKFEETKEQMQENQMISEQTLEKYDELNEFLEELENPEIEKLLEELQEQLENLSPEDIMEKMDQLEMNDEEMRKSLERTLELLKQLEVQQKVDELRNKLENLETKQELLNEKLDDAESPEDMENVGDRQEDLNEQMEDVSEDIEELKEMKEKTDTPDEEKMENLQEDAEETEEEMDQAASEMKQAAQEQQEGSRKNKKNAQQMKQNASESQKKAAQKMQDMAGELSDMQMSMQMQQDQQNLESLRELLENLLTLSFDQEDLRDEVKELKYQDPSLKDKSQQQKNLQDDMGLVKDSLEALANKVFQIQKMVLDESSNISDNMQKSQTFFRNKQIPLITYHQQGAMT
ncbi:MAG: hypothetical protein AAF399_09665, partial [Bacteroidota bacterium]